ncbi:MAG: hypothetical protein ACREMA_07500 [Longimicrobiales bacterium]
MTANVKGTGTLTLTTLTSTRVAGTFTFEGRLALDGSGQRVSVTNGRFDMPNPLPFE